MEVIGLSMFAPLLYSMFFVAKTAEGRGLRVCERRITDEGCQMTASRRTARSRQAVEDERILEGEDAEAVEVQG